MVCNLQADRPSILKGVCICPSRHRLQFRVQPEVNDNSSRGIICFKGSTFPGSPKLAVRENVVLFRWRVAAASVSATFLV
jgi:hypothetical protein